MTADPDLKEGLRLFNEGRFWEAHEAWERAWLRLLEPQRRFVQGLIQLAAAWHHVSRGNDRGARRLFTAALEKVREYPPEFLGIDRAECERTASMLAATESPSKANARPPRLREKDGTSGSP